MRKSSSALKIGIILNKRYLVEDILGQGGFGITYRALDKQNKRKIAIKEYFPSDIGFRDIATNYVHTSNENDELYQYGLTRFLDEANELARFQRHPGIVAVYDMFHEYNTAYMVMQYVEGMTLMNLVKKNGGKLKIEQAIPILLLTLDALRPVHEVGLLHRDISPDNIMILPNHQIKLIDFGAARYALKNQQHNYSIIYKVGYTPIEQYTTNGYIGPWSDIYALSASFYRVITGKLPLESTNRAEADTLIPPSRLGVNISEQLENRLMKGLAVKRDQRYQTVDEFKNSILQCPTYTSSELLQTHSSAQWVWIGIGISAIFSFFILIFVILF